MCHSGRFSLLVDRQKEPHTHTHTHTARGLMLQLRLVDCVVVDLLVDRHETAELTRNSTMPDRQAATTEW